MRDLRRTAQNLTDGEGGARDGPLHAKRTAGAAHERGLSAAELSAHEHDVTPGEAAGELRAGGLGVVRAVRVFDRRGHRYASQRAYEPWRGETRMCDCYALPHGV